ncbi:MAG: sensor histidine kinase [Lachnospiraceae bacterium]|nr:sensor histidine kinase [Lachnospiraceae bacterium]MDY5741764.1 sensor histidine kinase [Lachnospiraceae bacterium]
MKKHSLWLRYLIYSVAALTILLSLLSLAYYRIGSDAVKQLIEQKTGEAVQQASTFVSSYVQQLEQTNSALIENEILQAYVKSERETEQKALLQLMQAVLRTNHDLLAVTLVTKSGQVVSTDRNIKMQTSDDMMQQSWYQSAIAQKGMPVLTPAHQPTGAEAEDRWVISVTQEVADASGNNRGVLRLDIAYETLEHYLQGLQLGKEGFAFIIDDKHEFVYHPKKTVYSSKADMDSMKPYIRAGEGYVGSHTYVTKAKISGSQWTVIGVSSLEELQRTRTRILWAMLGITGTAFAGCLISIPLLTRRWLKPLRDLQSVILAVGNGQSGLRAEEKGSVELADLAHHFNLMLDRIDSLMVSIRENEQSIRSYELKALASQINPHFLYNTLDTIVWMAEFNDSRKVVEITKSLAAYFRLALNNGHEQIRLKDELEHVRQYLFIQQQRYGSKLSYEIEELSQYNDFSLPKLVLQPIVENAIYHGIKESGRPGLIRIRVAEKDGQLELSVYDNGKGLPIRMKAQNEEGLVRRGGIGLKNVDQRLKLQFGAGYHMTVSSEPDHYTEVVLSLPISS